MNLKYLTVLNKIIILCFVFTLITPAVLTLEENNTIEIINSTTALKNIVLAEYGSLSSCAGCPSVANYLQEIYESEKYNFYYISLVSDKNDASNQRARQLGIRIYPHVYFDGGVEDIFGDQGSIEPYESAIEKCLARESSLHDISMYLSVSLTNYNHIMINTTITNNMDCCGNEVYYSTLRVYVTELTSRWNDYSGNLYHCALIDYAFNENITVTHGTEFNLNVLWEPDDTFQDIDPENIMIFAAAFDENSQLIDDVAVSSILTNAPQTNLVEYPAGLINSSQVTFTWEGNDETTPKDDIVFSYKLDGYDEEWSSWSKSITATYENLGDKNFTFSVKSKDTDGNIDPTPAKTDFQIDTTPPDISIKKPLKNHLYFGNNFSIPFFSTILIGANQLSVTVEDTIGVESVEFHLNDQLIKLFDNAPYNWWWSSGKKGQYLFTVKSADIAGNEAEQNLKILKL